MSGQSQQPSDAPLTVLDILVARTRLLPGLHGWHFRMGTFCNSVHFFQVYLHQVLPSGRANLLLQG